MQNNVYFYLLLYSLIKFKRINYHKTQKLRILTKPFVYQPSNSLRLAKVILLVFLLLFLLVFLLIKLDFFNHKISDSEI